MTITTTIATVHGGTDLGGGARRPPRCQLVVTDGAPADRGRAVTVGGAGDRPIAIGSGEGCDLVLADDRVSRRHLEVRADGDGFRVRDLDSTNGTWYEGSRVGDARVGPGATLKLGRTFVRLVPEPEPLAVAPSQSRRFGELVAESLTMREVFAVLELAAAGDVTVLLEGETGTGKELAARALHEASPRRRGPLVAIDCGALPETLLESELFGHVRGAFTGAATRRVGAFARADGGTLFLDELGAVSPAVQARLLRVIEERRVRPVGADEERPIDVRLVAASRHDLAARVAEGAFRADLYYRLSVVRVVLPPLRHRREDIAPIVAELLRRRGIEAGPIAGAGPAWDALVAHDWPGNVRELRNVIDRALALSPGARAFADLRIAVGGGAGAVAGEDPLPVRTDLPWAEARQAVLHAFERRYLADVLGRASGNLSAAARASGIDRKHLRQLARRHGLLPGPTEGDADGGDGD